MIVIVIIAGLIYAGGIYWIIKLQSKQNKKKIFVKKVGEGKQLWFRGYSWVHVEADNKMYPGVLISYFDKEDGKVYQVTLKADYFQNNYISLEEKEKEGKNDNRN